MPLKINSIEKIHSTEKNIRISRKVVGTENINYPIENENTLLNIQVTGIYPIAKKSF